MNGQTMEISIDIQNMKAQRGTLCTVDLSEIRPGIAGSTTSYCTTGAARWQTPAFYSWHWLWTILITKLAWIRIRRQACQSARTAYVVHHDSSAHLDSCITEEPAKNREHRFKIGWWSSPLKGTKGKKDLVLFLTCDNPPNTRTKESRIYYQFSSEFMINIKLALGSHVAGKNVASCQWHISRWSR